MNKVVVSFENGTLRLAGLTAGLYQALPEGMVKFDARSECFRARGCDYAAVMTALKPHCELADEAKAFAPLTDLKLAVPIVPHPHQTEALAAWRAGGYRSVVALPTGSGKTVLAVMAMARLKRPTLVLVPTIDLLAQWAATLERFFARKIGILGGGAKEVAEITVSTYNSAVIFMESIGNRFAFLVVDECHHLPGPVNSLAAAWAIAPYRLGLSATPELDGERDAIMSDLIGPVSCRVHIDELEGGMLANYTVHTVELDLEPDERAEYEAERAVYTAFLRQNGIVLKNLAAWGRFLAAVARSGRIGNRAFRAFLRQRELARSGRAKLRQIWELLTMHAGERIILFTADNATAYQIGRLYALPVLTHHTKAAERKSMLTGFRDGTYPVLVSSKVLNEGVDVPEANVAIVVSGGASIREHVQRLGRILRRAPGKEAILYELVNAETSEAGVSQRRREHRAYQGHDEDSEGALAAVPVPDGV